MEAVKPMLTKLSEDYGGELKDLLVKVEKAKKAAEVLEQVFGFEKQKVHIFMGVSVGVFGLFVYVSISLSITYIIVTSLVYLDQCLHQKKLLVELCQWLLLHLLWDLG